jgi:hypothetical protein
MVRASSNNFGVRHHEPQPQAVWRVVDPYRSLGFEVPDPELQC